MALLLVLMGAGCALIAAGLVVWSRANSAVRITGFFGMAGSFGSRGVSTFLSIAGTVVVILATARLDRDYLGWWAWLLAIVGIVVAKLIPIIVHNRRVPWGSTRIASDTRTPSDTPTTTVL